MYLGILTIFLSCKLVKTLNISLTEDTDGSRFVVCPGNIGCYARVVTRILQSNPFKVKASVTPNTNIWILDQLGEEETDYFSVRSRLGINGLGFCTSKKSQISAPK